ncbi:S-layer homology domain-containing protein [uncultured Dysosmobacter sp.]|uniref:S-layer homology domain-containing protein n=1 Tax=uncultured Dysosmobacter sp. TaxID=2591384 RepID=UPI002673ADA9|nr:S-layer homology domain-containing protein [uncultured Dysosmobacter sp.]
MKKFLSLVLALVMTMSLVTVSAGAKDFTDNSKINYKEAVDVMSAAKVIDGYAEGDFRPANTLTRGAAAKIICNLILGPTTAEALVADAAPYSDVPTTNTFAGYIAYCAKEGIISGYADGSFRPAATLSGYAFMKMLLGALGYDATTEGYIGNNWSINVAKRALNVGLNDDLNGDFNGIKAVNREEACLYAFNTLKAPMVEYDNNNSVTVNGITFTNKSAAKDMKNTGKSDGNIKDDGKMQFAEKYFTDLKAVSATDDLGHPATKWMWKNDKIGTYGKKADETFTLTDTYAIGKNAKYASLQDVLRDEDFTDNEDLRLSAKIDDKTVTTKVYVNGVKVDADSTAVQNALKNAAKGGTTVELYYNDDNKDFVDYVTILNYSIAKIAVDNEGSFYLNVAGQIAAVDISSTSKDYIYIYAIDVDNSKVNSDGLKGTTVTAYYVTADGTKGSAEVDDIDKLAAKLGATTKNEDTDKMETDLVKLEAAKGVIAYSINSDKELVVEKEKNDIHNNVGTMTFKKGEANGADSDTQFIFAYEDNGKMKTSTATGYKNVSVTEQTVYTVTDKNDVLYVFVAAKNGSVNSDDKLAVLTGTSVSTSKDGDDTIYTYDVIIDGEETTLSFKSGNEPKFDLKKGLVFAYAMDGKYATVKDVTADVEHAKATTATKDYFTVGTAQYNLSDAKALYTINVEYKKDGTTIDSVYVTTGVDVDANDDVVYTLDDGDLDVLFVYDYIK